MAKGKKIEIPDGFVDRVVKEPNSICFLYLKGELRHWNLGVLNEIFQRELDAKVYRLVVNLSQVNVMLSCHIGAFITYLREVWPYGGDIKLSQVSDDNFARFCQMGLNDVISFYKTDDDAFNAFQNTFGQSKIDRSTKSCKALSLLPGDVVILNHAYRLAYLENISHPDKQMLPYQKLDMNLNVISVDEQNEKALLEDSTLERRWLALKYIERIN